MLNSHAKHQGNKSIPTNIWPNIIKFTFRYTNNFHYSNTCVFQY